MPKSNVNKKCAATKKLKKPPNAPKRFKSSYMFFSMSKHEEIRNNKEKESASAIEGNGSGGDFKTTEASESTKVLTPAQIVSQAWKDHTPEERRKYDDMARNDMARYYVEKELYSGPWKVTLSEYKNLQKDDNAPKKPMSSYLAYANYRRSEIKTRYPMLTNTEISRKLAEMWKVADDDERKFYIDEELELRKKYLSSMAEYKANKKVEENAKRKQREEYASSIASQCTAAAIKQARQTLQSSQQEKTETTQQHTQVYQQQLLQNSGVNQNSNTTMPTSISSSQAYQQLLLQNGGDNQSGNDIRTDSACHHPTLVGSMNNNLLLDTSSFEPTPFAPHQQLYAISQTSTAATQQHVDVAPQDNYLSNGFTTSTPAAAAFVAAPATQAFAAAPQGISSSGNATLSTTSITAPPPAAPPPYQQLNLQEHQHQNNILNALQDMMASHGYDTNTFSFQQDNTIPSATAVGESGVGVPSVATSSTTLQYPTVLDTPFSSSSLLAETTSSIPQEDVLRIQHSNGQP